MNVHMSKPDNTKVQVELTESKPQKEENMEEMRRNSNNSSLKVKSIDLLKRRNELLTTVF